MIYQITFVLAVMIYFHFESLSEQFTWTEHKTWVRSVSSKTYHIWRFFEWVGILGGVILFQFVQNYLILFLSITVGLSWYELIWNHRMYGSIWHRKEGYWSCKILRFKIRIRYPAGWFWLVVLILSLIGLVLIIGG